MNKVIFPEKQKNCLPYLSIDKDVLDVLKLLEFYNDEKLKALYELNKKVIKWK